MADERELIGKLVLKLSRQDANKIKRQLREIENAQKGIVKTVGLTEKEYEKLIKVVTRYEQELSKVKNTLYVQEKLLVKSRRRAEYLKIAFVGVAAAGTAMLAPFLTSLNSYIKTAGESELLSREWIKTTDDLKKSQVELGRITADALLPYLRLASGLADKIANFARQNPGIVKAGITIAGSTALLGGIGVLVAEGIRIRDSAKLVAVSLAQQRASQKMAKAAAAQLTAAGLMMRASKIEAGAEGFEGLRDILLAGAGSAGIAGTITGLSGTAAAASAAGASTLGVIAAGAASLAALVASIVLLVNVAKNKGAQAAEALNTLTKGIITVTFGLAGGIIGEGGILKGGNFYEGAEQAINEIDVLYDNTLSTIEDKLTGFMDGITGRFTGAIDDASDYDPGKLERLIQAMNDIRELNQLEEDYRQQKLQLTEEHERDVLELTEDYNRSVERAEEDHKQKLAEMARDFAIREQRAEEDYYDKRKEEAEDYNEDIQEAEKKHQQKIKDIRDRYAERIQDAIARRDALDLIRAQREYEKQRKAEEEDYKERLKDRQKEFADRIKDLEDQFRKERRRRLEDYRLRVKDANDAFNKQRRLANEQYNRQLQELKRRYDLEYKLLQQEWDREYKLHVKYWTATHDVAMAYLNAMNQAANKSAIQAYEDRRENLIGRSIGGYVGAGTYKLHDGEFVLNRNTVKFLESLNGRPLTQSGFKTQSNNTISLTIDARGSQMNERELASEIKKQIYPVLIEVLS